MIYTITQNLLYINNVIEGYISTGDMTFNDAWKIYVFYRDCKDTGKIIDYIETELESDSQELLKDIEMLQTESSRFLKLYYANRHVFEKIDFEMICNKHLSVFSKKAQDAHDISNEAWDRYKVIDNRIDNAWYSGNDDPKLEEEHAKLKAEYDKLSQYTQGLYQGHRDEQIRISGLFCLKIGAVVMLVSVLSQMSTVVVDGYETHKNTGGA